jgi:hypothetical protein
MASKETSSKVTAGPCGVKAASCLQGAASKSHRMSLAQLHYLRKIATNFPSHMQTWPDNFDAHRFLHYSFPCANGVHIQNRNSTQLPKQDLAGKSRRLTCRAYYIFQPLTTKSASFSYGVLFQVPCLQHCWTYNSTQKKTQRFLKLASAVSAEAGIKQKS